MQYRVNPKNGDEISILGHGGMHFQKDDEAMIAQLRYAVEQGVNYIDTAYIYPGSEVLIGKALEGGWRDRVFLADKLPPYLVRKAPDMDKVFFKQLERLRTDRLDYYMMHMLTDLKDWQRLCALGIVNWAAQKKREGKIRNFGFSFHGGVTEFKKLVDAFDWDFCMIQYNYYDENKQAGKSGLQYAMEKGIPVIVMEPLRGGSLMKKLPKQAQEAFAKADATRTPAQWALDWVWSHPQVLTLLSGMHDKAVLDENLRSAEQSTAKSLTTQEFAVYQQAVQAIDTALLVPCTGCAYCMPCPAGVDIPLCFSCLNEKGSDGFIRAQIQYIMRNNSHQASLCSNCGKCEKHCPQNIRVREQLAQVRKTLEGPLYRPLRFAVRTVMKTK